MSPFHLASYVLIGGGFWLIAAAWRVLHEAALRGLRWTWVWRNSMMAASSTPASHARAISSGAGLVGRRGPGCRS